ncbi:peptidoglycan DD-metalloendopeptidase family protein [Bacillaceae bacterium S4-13-56]
MKRILSYSTILAVLLLLLVPEATLTGAAGLSDVNKKIEELNEKKKELNEQKGNLSSEAKTTEQKIEENQQQQAQVNQRIIKLQDEIETTEKSIGLKEQEIATNVKEIDETDKEIKQLETEIEEMQERIVKRDELLKNRLRSLQQSGGEVSYLEVIMGAQSFGDFLNRATVVNKIMDQDKTILETHVSEKESLENKKVEVEDKKQSLIKKKEDLETQKKELETLQASLADKVAEQEVLLAQLETEESELEEYKLTLAQEQEIVRREAAALQQAIKQAEEEKKRLEQLSQSNSYSGGGGFFAWPAGTRNTTSEFNPYRLHPIYKIVRPHRGLDIAARGDIPIYAAESGVVYIADRYYEGYGAAGFGNVVFITHWLNGQVYTTVYAHMRDMNVSEGQTVTRGQQIGWMGSTGDSTGQHLHFEVHEGGYGNAVNPRKYLQ